MIDWLKNFLLRHSRESPVVPANLPSFSRISRHSHEAAVIPANLPSFPRRRESSHFNTFGVVVFEKITIAVVTKYYPLFQELKEKVNGLLHEQDDLTELS